jgi:hypothetical protein
LAEFLYCEQGITLTEISERIDIPMKTLSLWKKGNVKKGKRPWDERKRINLSAPHNIKEFILVEMEKIVRGKKSDVDADALVKLANSLEKVEKKINPQVVVTVLMQLETWMANDNPDEAVKSLPHHKKFILHVMNNG